MAGKVTISAGTWATPRTSTIIASAPAHGTPATSRVAASPCRPPIRLARGQDQRPDHQGQERGENPVAQQDHGEDQAGADQDLQQGGSQPLFEFLIRRGGEVDGSTPVNSSYTVSR